MAKTISLGLLTMLYPFAVYFGTRYFEPWKIGCILFVLLGIRLIASYFIRGGLPGYGVRFLLPTAVLRYFGIYSERGMRRAVQGGPFTQPNIETTHENLHHHPGL